MQPRLMGTSEAMEILAALMAKRRVGVILMLIANHNKFNFGCRAAELLWSV